MGKSLSPSVRKELRNLEKDPESRKSAMESLKSHIEELNSESIPEFVEQIYESKEPGSSHLISLFEILVRQHGPDLLPQIGVIMDTIIKDLSLSAGNLPLQQACSRLVVSIARYGIRPIIPVSSKREIILSLSMPLAGALLASQESLSSGAALCLKLLVDFDNWRYASSDTVNLVCSNVTRVLQDKPFHTNSHMGLVISLAKRNPIVIGDYFPMLLHSGLRDLKGDGLESNHRNRLIAIQMINSLMASLDPGRIISELGSIILEMERCQHDRIGYVKGAAFEALQTANKIMRVKGVSFDVSMQNGGDLYPLRASPESQMVDSHSESDSIVGSTSPASHVSPNEHSFERKHCVYENGGVRDGISGNKIDRFFSSGPSLEPLNELRDRCGNEVARFLNDNTASGELINENPNSVNSNTDKPIGIFTTPRRLNHPLHDPIDGSNASVKQRLQGTNSGQGIVSSKMANDRGGVSTIMNCQSGIYPGSPRRESVSSTDDNNVQSSLEETGNGDKLGKEGNLNIVMMTGERAGCRGSSVGFSLVVLFAAFIAASVLWFGDSGCCDLVPT